MRRVFIGCVLFLCSAVLAGCELTSSRPLLDPSDAVPAFGDQFLAVGLEQDGGFLNQKGEAATLTARADGATYQIVLDDPDEKGTIRFYPAGELPFDYVLELAGPQKTSYVAARTTETDVAVLNIALTDAMLATLKQRGIAPTKKGMVYEVESRGALTETVRAWAEAALIGQADVAFPYRFVIATTEQAKAALMASVNTELCLSRAGHPLDPAVKRLKGKFAHGVTLDRIDAAAAMEACGWGATSGAPASVRYALARAHFRAGDYEKTHALTDALMAEDFGLAYVMRADLLVRGIGVAEDKAAARGLLEKAAPRHPVAAYTLGLLTAYGQFGEPDFTAVRRYYEQAAEAGIAPARVGLGLLYRNGTGVEKDEARAYRLFHIAAASGDAQGHMEAGRALYFGIGTKQDYDSAFGHLKIAADAGIADAQYIAGFMRARGQGTEKSERAAIELLTRASDAGVLAAKAELGWMTYQGLGATADRAKGRRLLEEAAGEGSPIAKEYLALLDKPSLPAMGPNVPSEVQADVTRLSGDQPFQLNRVNMQFMAGMAQYLGERCKLPSTIGDRLELAGLAINGASSLLGGPDYSNPDLGKAVGSMLGSTALFAAGVKFAEQIPCDSGLATHMAERLVAASRSNKGGDNSPFIPSCAIAFDQARCACLAQIGRGVIPDIYQQTYHRGIIQEIISRNPLLGLTISLTCQIGNY